MKKACDAIFILLCPPGTKGINQERIIACPGGGLFSSGMGRLKFRPHRVVLWGQTWEKSLMNRPCYAVLHT